jgi:long-chain acyl-CoA synthetase
MNDFITDLRICKPTILALVPALAELVWSLLKKDKEIVGGRLKTIICGGAPVPPSLIKKLFAEGINIHPGYGLTETANLVSGNANPLDKPTSVGRPFNFQEIKIVDGELWIKGENVVKEYYHNPINTKLAFEGEWLKTGDLAKIDKDGDLYIVGRIKNLIIFDNGEKVSPEALENELNNYPLIKDSLVYGDKNESGNQVITAEILPNIEYAKNVKISDITLAIHNIIDEINNHVPIYMGIHKIIIRTQDFERSSSKKIIRKY